MQRREEGGRDAIVEPRDQRSAGSGEVARQPRPSSPPMTLAAATRDYAQAVEARRFDRLGDRELVSLIDGMGAEIWAWQYAKRLTGQTPWRAYPNLPDKGERVRASQQMRAEIAIWEKALAALRVLTENARRYGQRLPDPLRVPADILAVIDARQVAAVQRAVRRSARAGEGDAAVQESSGFPKPF